jgi:hypothetical protein
MEQEEEILTIILNGEKVKVKKHWDKYIIVHDFNVWEEEAFLDELDEIDENTYKLLMEKFNMKERWAKAKVRDHLDLVNMRIWA